MTINTPSRENAFSETIFAGTSNVIHDLVATILNNRFANSRSNIVKRGVPGGLFPFSCAAFAGALEWKQDAIGIVNLVECGRALSAVATARAGMLGIAFKLLHFAGDFVDVGQQTAGGFAVETSGGN